MSLVDMLNVSASRKAATEAGEATRAEVSFVLLEVAWCWASDDCDNEQAPRPIARHAVSESPGTARCYIIEVPESFFRANNELDPRIRPVHIA